MSVMKVVGWIVGVLLTAVALFAGYIWLALQWSYSQGDRAGYVQKFSEKGWICKTWEGEMQMTPVPGTVPEKFLFSVRDEAVVRKINTSLGKRVVLHYEQHKGLPTDCFGETDYFIVDVKVME